MTENFTPAKAGGQRPRLSKEEYAEKKRAEKDAVYQLADEAAKEIVSSPEKFKAFLDTQSRLDRYSAVNAPLCCYRLTASHRSLCIASMALGNGTRILVRLVSFTVQYPTPVGQVSMSSLKLGMIMLMVSLDGACNNTLWEKDSLDPLLNNSPSGFWQLTTTWIFFARLKLRSRAIFPIMSFCSLDAIEPIQLGYSSM